MTLLDTKEQWTDYTRSLTRKLDELKIGYRTVWEPGRGEDVTRTGGGGQSLVHP